MNGKILNNTYKLEKALSEGGMGQVFVASHLRIPNRCYAIKKLLPELASSPKFRERFQAEAQAMMALDHPNIVKIEDFLIEEDVYFLVMEFVESRSLEEKIFEMGRLSPEEINKLMLQLLDGLEFCHHKGVIHRDLKPSNLLLTRDGTLKISDFGISRHDERQQKLTATGTILGTPEYMSPEQIMGISLDGRSDIYSAGVILYEMISGTLPFGRNPETQGSYTVLFAHMNNDPPPITTPGVPTYLRSAVCYCLEKRPEDRFQSVRELRDYLESGFMEFSGIEGAKERVAPHANTREEQRSSMLDSTRGTVENQKSAEPENGTVQFQREPKRSTAKPVDKMSSTSRGGGFFRLLVGVILAFAVVAAGFWWWEHQQRSRPEVGLNKVLKGDTDVTEPKKDPLPNPKVPEEKSGTPDARAVRKTHPRSYPPQLRPGARLNPRIRVPEVVRKVPVQRAPSKKNQWPLPVSEECRIWLGSCLKGCLKRRSSQDISPKAACRRHCWGLRLREPYRLLCKDS